MDRSSGAYGFGSAVGMVHSFALPGGGALRGLQTYGRGKSAFEGLQKGVQGIAEGDPLKALQGFGEGASGGFLKTDLCKVGNKLAAAGIKGTMLAGGAAHGIDAVASFASGDVLGGLGSTAQGLFMAAQGSKSCFVAGTPLRTSDGSRAIETIRDYHTHGEGCDRVLSRSEFDPRGPLELKRVLRRFVRVSPVLNLSVGGQVIGTTAEHPFFAEGRGWMPAGELKAGDRLALHDGDWLKVDGVADSGRVLTVYNLEVEGFHTYFVGSVEWGFAVWAHNAKDYAIDEALEMGVIRPVSRARAGVLTEGQLFHQHHLLPQSSRRWFQRRGVDVDDFTVRIDRTTHSALHAGGGRGRGGGWWNAEIMQRMRAREADLGRRMSTTEIEGVMNTMRSRFGLGNLPILRYQP